MPATSSAMDWNDQAISTLRTLWSEGHSTAEIGRRMGVSKNAIVGKSHRLHLPPRRSPIRARDPATPPRLPHPRCPSLAELQGRSSPEAAPSLPPPLAAKLPPVSAPPIRLVGLDPVAAQATPAPAPVLSRHPCCWPCGEPGTAGFRFCEAPSEAGKPYCPDHCASAYANRIRRRTAA